MHNHGIPVHKFLMSKPAQNW